MITKVHMKKFCILPIMIGIIFLSLSNCNYHNYEEKLNSVSSFEEEVQLLTEFNNEIHSQSLSPANVSVGFYIDGKSCTPDIFHQSQNVNSRKTIKITVMQKIFGIYEIKDIIEYSPKYKDAYFILLRE